MAWIQGRLTVTMAAAFPLRRLTQSQLQKQAAWLAQYPNDRERARGFLQGFVHHLDEACIGSISEVFDAQAPFTPRGCIAQAWSVAEVLRAWVNTTM